MPIARHWSSRFLLFTAGAACVAFGWSTFGCGEEGSTSSDTPSPGPTNEVPPAPFPPSDPHSVPDAFPNAPILDGDVPPNVAELFASAQASPAGGPCLMEPEVGAMLPKNWLRPRFRWIAPNALSDAGATGPELNLFEIRVHADDQPNDLVVYTRNRSWTMPKDMWDALRQRSVRVPMTMTIRGGTFDGTTLTNVSVGSSGPLTIAPVEAPGSIVYWTTISGGPSAEAGVYNPELKGFRVGDESVTDVLRPSQMPPTDAGAVRCVGCHTSTPDGDFAVASIRPNPSGGGFTQIGFASVDGMGSKPSYVTAQAQQLLDRSQQSMPSFSPAHFSQGDRIAVTMYRTAPGFDIIWTNLETTSTAPGTGWGVFARTGDTGWAAAADVSHDGTKIVYVSTTTENSAGVDVTNGKLYTIPWNDRKGGTATELAGANADGFKQFYPAFSPDDALVAFARSPQDRTSYADPNAELYVVSASGGTAQRLAANDPPACSGVKSPGVFNAWPKWSPDVGTDGGKKYYFVVFSSSRNQPGQRFGARLYITPIVVEGSTITTYSALYLWNQPETEDNHSPSWTTLKIQSSIPK